MMPTPLQLPSVNHDPSCDGISMCARDAEETEGNAKTQFDQKNIVKERLGHYLDQLCPTQMAY